MLEITYTVRMVARPPGPIFATADAAEEAFYDALERGDLKGLMSLWSDDEDTVCVHPGGPRLVGLDAIRASWEQIFAAGGGIAIRLTSQRVYEGAVLSVRNLVEQITVHGKDGPRVVHCVATNVFQKSPVGWRIVLHQSGPMPEADDSPEPGDRLH